MLYFSCGDTLHLIHIESGPLFFQGFLAAVSHLIPTRPVFFIGIFLCLFNFVPPSQRYRLIAINIVQCALWLTFLLFWTSYFHSSYEYIFTGTIWRILWHWAVMIYFKSFAPFVITFGIYYYPFGRASFATGFRSFSGSRLDIQFKPHICYTRLNARTKSLTIWSPIGSENNSFKRSNNFSINITHIFNTDMACGPLCIAILSATLRDTNTTDLIIGTIHKELVPSQYIESVNDQCNDLAQSINDFFLRWEDSRLMELELILLNYFDAGITEDLIGFLEEGMSIQATPREPIQLESITPIYLNTAYTTLDGTMELINIDNA